ncbi:hypothetical protein [Krasilnikovia cinnamomea]|uniref:hypothetical protein n=1 Tax=Krasilnikovia cinnamomea TaxID=349313 RepID=UPI00102ABDCB|nr:hypothetical protein [Krasilnikovia cinnamomea]
MSNSIPWWGVPIVAGLFALAGVFVSQLFTYRIEKVRTHREEQKWWREEKQKTYLRFLSATKQLEQQIIKKQDGDKFDSRGWGEDTKELLRSVMEVFDEVNFISTDDVCDAATSCLATTELFATTWARETDRETMKEVRRRFQAARKMFMMKARMELGLEPELSQEVQRIVSK